MRCVVIIYNISGAVFASFFIVMACVKVRKKGWSFLLIGIGLAINALVAPISFGLSFFATVDEVGGGFLDQIQLFLFCQSIPLLILFICVLVYFIIKDVNQKISK